MTVPMAVAVLTRVLVVFLLRQQVSADMGWTATGQPQQRRHPFANPSGRCSLHPILLGVGHRGCQSGLVRTLSCRGTCPSSAAPAWKYEDQDLRIMRHCSCCSSYAIFHLKVPLACEDGLVRNVTVGAMFSCACRPCSHAIPDPERPYRYHAD